MAVEKIFHFSPCFFSAPVFSFDFVDGKNHPPRQPTKEPKMATKKKTNAPAAPTLIRKITMRDCCGEIKRPTEETALLRVLGLANAVQSGESSYGVWHALLGQFKATNLVTGEVFMAGKTILPPIAQEGIVGALQNALPGTSMEIAYDISIIPDSTPTGYSYRATPLLADQGDAMDALEAKIMLALPA